jgi:hypothetical protein
MLQDDLGGPVDPYDLCGLPHPSRLYDQVDRAVDESNDDELLTAMEATSVIHAFPEVTGDQTDPIQQHHCAAMAYDALRKGSSVEAANDYVGHGSDVSGLAAFGVQQPFWQRIQEHIRDRMKVRIRLCLSGRVYALSFVTLARVS